MSLVLMAKRKRKRPKTPKTKIVRKKAYMRLSEAKVDRQVKFLQGAPKEGSFVIF